MAVIRDDLPPLLIATKMRCLSSFVMNGKTYWCGKIYETRKYQWPCTDAEDEVDHSATYAVDGFALKGWRRQLVYGKPTGVWEETYKKETVVEATETYPP